MLAHQGGWDEIALVAVPIVIFAALLWLANRRANAAAEGLEAEPEASPEPDAKTGSDPP